MRGEAVEAHMWGLCVMKLQDTAAPGFQFRTACLRQ